MKRTHARTIVVLGLISGGLGACRVESNGRLALGEDLRMAGTDPAQIASHDEAPAIPARGSTLRPVPVTLDRSQWEARVFMVPYDGVRHIPSYTTQWTPHYDHRSGGGSPTPMSALELGHAGYDMGVMEGVGNGAIGVFDAVMIVPRALAWDYFWERNQSPQWPYERRASSPWLALSLAPEASDQSATGTLRHDVDNEEDVATSGVREDESRGAEAQVDEAAPAPEPEPASEDIPSVGDGEADEPDEGADRSLGDDGGM